MTYARSLPAVEETTADALEANAIRFLPDQALIFMAIVPSRRQFLRSSAILGVGGTIALLGSAQEADTRASSDPFITSDTQNTISRGLAILAGNQARNGSFSDLQFSNVAVSGLAGLALMAAGNQAGRGQYGGVVSKIIDYLLSRSAGSRPPGYLHSTDLRLSHSAMYQHGFGTLFLSEVYGMVPEWDRQKRVRELLEKAVAVILNAQNHEGGWRYEAEPSQADVSVTVAQLMALRAARNAGVYVPKSKVDKAVEYILGCQLNDGGFCYIRSRRSGGSGFARSAAAVVGLFSAGIYDSPEIERGLNYLIRFAPGRRGNFFNTRPEHYFYGHYYAALAMWTAGGNYWTEWFPAIRDELVAKFRAGGNRWTDMHGESYATAMSCIILQLPNNYLPILQK